MADGVTITIEGTAGIDAAFKRLHDLGSRKRDITKIFSNNMRPLMQAGKATAPKSKSGGRSKMYASRTHSAGTLRRSIKFATSKKFANVWYVVARRSKSSNSDAWYAHMVGQGTKHQRANPFMDRAWEATKGGVLSGLERDLMALGQKLWEGK